MNNLKSLITYLENNKSKDYIGWAIENGHLEIVRYVYEKKYYTDDILDEYLFDYIIAASENGHLDVIIYVWENIIKGDIIDDNKYNIELFVDVVINSTENLDIIEYMYDKCNEDQLKSIIHHAIKCNQLDKLKYICERNSPETMNKLVETDDMDYIAYMGRLEMMQYLYSNGIGTYSGDSMIFASRNGHLESVKFLYENYFHTFDEYVYDNALRAADNNNRKEVVVYLTC